MACQHAPQTTMAWTGTGAVDVHPIEEKVDDGLQQRVVVGRHVGKWDHLRGRHRSGRHGVGGGYSRREANRATVTVVGQH